MCPPVPAAVPGQRVSRFDVAEIGKPTRTPQGFLRVPAYLTRVGVFAYTRADGTTVRELRPAEEVFREDSLATLSSAPVTDLHPTEMVSPTNVRKLRVGHVGEAVRKDGHLVAATITVEDHEIISKVERGERREISCGYRCRIDATPGTHNGEAYDVVQRDIVYNHAALGPRNWGRAGADVSLRVDSGAGDDKGSEQVFRLDASDAVSAETHSAPSERNSEDDDDMDMTSIRVDGIEVQVSKQGAPIIEREIKQRTDAAVESTKALDTLQGKFDAQAVELDKIKKQLAEATDPKRLDAAVNERAALVEQARRVLGAEEKLDGKTPRQVHELVLKKLDDKSDFTGKSDEYVLARFDGAIASLPADGGNGGGERNDALDRARKAAAGSGGGVSKTQTVRQDAAPLADWQKPLTYSKDAD